MAAFAELGELGGKLGEGDFDGYKVYFGVGLGDELDEIISVAIDGDETAGLLAGLELEGFGGAAAIDVLIGNEAAGLLVLDGIAEGLSDSYVIAVVVGEELLDAIGGVAGGGVDFLFDFGLNESEIEHAAILGGGETEVFFDDFHEGFFAAGDAADAEVTSEFGGDFFVGDFDLVGFGELEGVSVLLGFDEGGLLVLRAEGLDGRFVIDLAGLALDGGDAAAVEHEVVGEADVGAIDGGDWDGEDFGDTKEHVVGHVELVEGEPAAEHQNGSDDKSNQNRVDDDAMFGPLEGIFEFAAGGEDFFAALGNFFLLGFCLHAIIISLKE